MTEHCLLNRWGRVRGWAALWAMLASAVCAVALWRYAALVDAHTSELHKIFSYAPNGVIVCNDKGSVLYANDTVKAITGYSELDLQKGGVEQVIPPELRELHRAAFSSAILKCQRGLEGINYQKLMPVQCKNGSVIICLVSVGNVRHERGPHFFAFIMPVRSGQPAGNLSLPQKAPQAPPGIADTEH